uniref:Uncharacterized protein n=1 Tax=Auxenochlorella protothecoides TaxID=3075 RepID=A0A1D2ABM9_AUXPR
MGKQRNSVRAATARSGKLAKGSKRSPQVAAAAPAAGVREKEAANPDNPAPKNETHPATSSTAAVTNGEPVSAPGPEAPTLTLEQMTEAVACAAAEQGDDCKAAPAPLPTLVLAEEAVDVGPGSSTVSVAGTAGDRLAEVASVASAGDYADPSYMLGDSVSPQTAAPPEVDAGTASEAAILVSDAIASALTSEVVAEGARGNEQAAQSHGPAQHDLASAPKEASPVAHAPAGQELAVELEAEGQGVSVKVEVPGEAYKADSNGEQMAGCNEADVKQTAGTERVTSNGKQAAGAGEEHASNSKAPAAPAAPSSLDGGRGSRSATPRSGRRNVRFEDEECKPGAELAGALAGVLGVAAGGTGAAAAATPLAEETLQAAGGGGLVGREVGMTTEEDPRRTTKEGPCAATQDPLREPETLASQPEALDVWLREWAEWGHAHAGSLAVVAGATAALVGLASLLWGGPGRRRGRAAPLWH